MTFADSKEIYAQFLLSDFWINLSRTKRRLISKCEQCGSKKALQAHHRRYPDHLFDVRLDDLEVLCRDCHEKHHHIQPQQPKLNLPEQWAFITSLKDLDRLRSSRAMDRKTFLMLRSRFPPKHKKDRHRVKRHKFKRRTFQKVSKFYPYASLHNRPHWVNRGTSSN